jgi:soluble lytic murein transglycosylase-like protein
LDPDVEKTARFLAPRAAGTLDPLLRRQVAAVVVEEARIAGFDPLFVLAVMEVESSFIPEAVSVADAKGLLQLRDITLREISKHEALPPQAAEEPEAVVHLRLGIRYLAMMHRKYADPRRALAAWNAGPVAVDRELATSGRVPERWRNFARRVEREHENLLRLLETTEPLARLEEGQREG